MEKQKKIPPVVKIGSWVLCLIVFAVGFWHTHLGLKEMRPFGTEFGSIAIAAIVLLLLLITYYFAVSGNKTALIFYIFCGLFFFTFNMNYFYPSYLARKLVREDASTLNDTLQSYSNKSKRLLTTIGFSDNDNSLRDYNTLELLKNSVVDEVRGLGGVGERTKGYLKKFNEIITNHNIPTVTLMGNASTKASDLANYYEGMMSGRMRTLLENSTSEGSDIGDAKNFIFGVAILDSLQRKYTPILKDSIIPDNSQIELEKIKDNTQIITLQKLATGIDEACFKINEASKKRSNSKKNDFALVGEIKSQNLGRIAHTVSSVKERINKIDTWAIIFICLFIDLLVPLAIYLLLERKDVKDDETTKILGPKTF